MIRYQIDEIKEFPGTYIVEDCRTGVICMFEKGRFNETQNFRNLPIHNPMSLPKIMREMGDWLYKNHRDKI